VVYAITQIPVDLIRAIVRAEMKALGTPPAQLAHDVTEQRHARTFATATEKRLRAFYKAQRKLHSVGVALATTAERFNMSPAKVRILVLLLVALATLTTTTTRADEALKN
jgi:phage shock protein PspC (stress-responsive transcriptional regulator)